MKRPVYILPVIIFSQFAGTSLWFAGNAVVSDLQAELGIGDQSVAYITSAVQLGFIVGTLVFAFLSLADRFSPRTVFLVCSLAGAAANLTILGAPAGLTALLVLRFFTGFFLAGIYPVGMKIAASWFEKGLGRALGYLVGALVLGTAFPHLLRGFGAELPWQAVMLGVSALATCGGLLMFWLVPDGPNLPRGSRFDPATLFVVFRSADFRASAFGYFGHMWELYTLWAFIPVWLLAYGNFSSTSINISIWTFVIISMGFVGCAVGGVLSRRIGSARVAAAQLLISGICCLLSPLFFHADSWLFLGFLVIWGISVVGDSPQFSALNAQHAPKQYVGSALTIVNSIGFLITVFSIQLVSYLMPLLGPEFIFWLLLPGPVLGLLAFRSLLWTSERGKTVS